MNAETKISVVIAGWILFAILVLFAFPAGLQWLIYIPCALLVLAVLIAGGGIILMRFGYLKSRRATVNHKIIASCYACPIALKKDNPWGNVPIYNCMDAANRTIYTPEAVPRWCPNLSKVKA